MKVVVVVFCLALNTVVFSQQVLVQREPQTLRERYLELKAKAETYGEYKVIKEYNLDREWKIFADSLQSMRGSFHAVKDSVADLQSRLQRAQTTLAEKIESMAPLEKAGTHVAFFGIDIRKSAFIASGLMIFAALLTLTGVMALSVKNMNAALNERNEVLTTVNHEFEEYKHKALEKQMKLSRELQSERNRLLELKKIEKP